MLLFFLYIAIVYGSCYYFYSYNSSEIVDPDFLVINRATGYYFYSYDSAEDFYPSLPDPNNLIYHHDPMSGCPAPIQNITVNKLAQEILFINERPPGYNSTCVGDNLKRTTVEICEVKVMGKISLLKKYYSMKHAHMYHRGEQFYSNIIYQYVVLR